MTKAKGGKKRFGLSKAHTYKYAREFFDLDYIAQLGPAEVEWLRKFCAEYYQNTFVRNGRDLQNDEQRKECYRNTNARQRDVWNNLHRSPTDYAGGAAPEDTDEDDNGQDR